uniref:FMN-dependent alpha-hydroxy acid dehydrogenase n=1 Tax=Mycena chlorophos TaxID=658473 RepID=A0ABQ0LYV6_MYCCL|nr:FMN-dependent alpha-hydroxy acid dehydrogenase [Mycena chlorophos]
MRPTLVLLFVLSGCLRSALAVWIDMEGLPDTGLNTSSWVTGVLPDLTTDIWDLNDMQIAAKNVLAPKYYASYRTGALNEFTYQANLNIYSKVRLNGFSFRDVSNMNVA